MTKTIKNITPRAIGDTFDVAYLSDLSAVGSDISAKIEHIRKAIGGEEWKLSSEALTFSDLNYISAGSYSIKSAFEQMDTELYSVIGSFNSSDSFNWIYTDYSVTRNLIELDAALGKVGSGNYHILDSNSVASNLEALDNAIGEVGSGTYISHGNVAHNLEALDDAIGILANGYYIEESDSVADNLMALDGAIGEVGSGNWIKGSDNVASNLEALDGAIGKVGSGGNWILADEVVARNLERLDDAIGKPVSDGSYINASDSVASNLEALDGALDNVDSLVTNAIAGFGSYYSSNTETWTFPTSATYLSAASDLTEALSSLNHGLENATTAGEVTLSATAGSGGLLSVYTLYQGGVEKGTINIPKDFLVKSATLETVVTENVPYAGAHVGDKYIDFVINSKEAPGNDDHIYLPVNDLVDVYTVAPNATEVQLAIDSSNVISAALVDSGVTTSRIADSAVTTAKVLDSAVTTVKIADGAVNTDKIKLVDTADSSKAYTLQVTNGRLQVKEIDA